MDPQKEPVSPIIDIINIIVVILFATFCIVYIVSPGTGVVKIDPGNKNENQIISDAKKDEDFFKTDSSNKYTALYIDEKTPSFENQPYFIKHSSPLDLMVPAFETMSLMGAAADIKDPRIITAYKKNVYVKIMANSDTAYVNGAKRGLTHKAAIKKGVIYCPISFIASSLNYDLREKNGKVYAKQKAHMEIYSEFAGLYYKSSLVPKLNATISVPDYWKSLSKENYYYGYKEGNEESSLTISSYKPSSKVVTKGISAITDAYIKDNLSAVKKISEKSYDKVNDLSYSRLLIPHSNTYKNVIFLVTDKSMVYVLRFTAKSPDNTAFFVSSFEHIISTFKVNSLKPDYNQDHYIEKDLYFQYGIDTKGSIYSGQTSYRSFEFKASYSYIPPGKRIIAVVEKSGSKSRFPISAKDGILSGRIYLPFGLGSHNIKIAQVDGDISNKLAFSQAKNDENVILETNIINTNTNIDTYVVPSYYIDSDNELVKSTSKDIAISSIKQIDKAREIFKYICTNYKLVYSGITNQASITLKLKEGTSKELNMLYSALLRAQEIPARVSSYRDGGLTKYITEVEINGKWIIVDLTGGVIAHSKERPFSAYFAIDHKKFNNHKVVTFN